MNFLRRLVVFKPSLFVAIFLSPSLPLLADESASVEQRLSKLEQLTNNPGINNADNAWVLVCTALVLLMTAPGLILFYGGLVRRKNVLATMMHTLLLMALVSTIWMVSDTAWPSHPAMRSPEIR